MTEAALLAAALGVAMGLVKIIERMIDGFLAKRGNRDPDPKGNGRARLPREYLEYMRTVSDNQVRIVETQHQQTKLLSEINATTLKTQARVEALG